MRLMRISQRSKKKRLGFRRITPSLEQLEGRLLLTVSAGPDLDALIGSPTQFTGSYSGTEPFIPSWDFDYDGTFNSMESGTLNPTHVFAAPGLYTVALKVTTEEFPCGEMDLLTVNAAYAGPTTDAGAAQAGMAGDTLSFHGSFTDTDGIVPQSGIAWDFNWDGISFSPEVSGTLTPTWTYSDPGTYTVAVQVTDDHGVADIGFTQADIGRTATVANAGPDFQIALGESVRFPGSAEVGPNDTLVSIDWDFDYVGPVFYPDPTASGNLTPTHEFDATGTFSVAIRVIDAYGVATLDTAYVEVTSVRPLVSLTEEVTVSQGQLAAFAAQVTCVDPVIIDWDFHYEDGIFDPDPSGAGQLAPSTVYFEAGTYLAAIRVTNSNGGATRLACTKVIVSDVAPTASLTYSTSPAEGAQTMFQLDGITDPNPEAAFEVEADWYGTGDFAYIPREWAIGANTISFYHVFDDNGVYPVTIRLSDTEGSYTDYATTVDVQNVAPSVAVLAVGGEFDTLGPAVPIRIEPDDPSHADNVAGFQCYYSIDDGPYQLSQSGDFFLPSQTGWHTVQAYAVDKDGGVGPVLSRGFSVASAGMSFANYGTGAVRLNWSGASAPVVLQAPGIYDFGGVVSGLSVTLLTSNAQYGLSTNGSIDLIDYESGVTDVNLSVSTMAGTWPIVGDGHIGPINLAGGTAASSSRVTVTARGDFGGIVGPTGYSDLFAEADQITVDDLIGSITGMDHIASITARWLGGGTVWANHGIGSITAFGISATINSERCFNADLDPDNPGLYLSAGHGGASGFLDLGRVTSLSTAGSMNDVSIKLLQGTVSLERSVNIGNLNIADTLGQTLVNDDYGSITQIVLGEPASKNPPVLQFFPLAFPLVIAPTDYAADFWAQMDRQSRELLRDTRGWPVHHTHFQQLAPVFEARGIDIHAVERLRAVHRQVHAEITRRQLEWVDEEMKRINSNWSWNNQLHRNAFLRRVRNDDAFYGRLTQFQANMESQYSNYWVRANDTRARIRQVDGRLNSARGLARFRIGEGSRMRNLFRGLGAALAFFSIIESSSAAAALVAGGHNQEQEAAFGLLTARYQAALQQAIQRRAPPDRALMMDLNAALNAYLGLIGIRDEVRNGLYSALAIYIADYP